MICLSFFRHPNYSLTNVYQKLISFLKLQYKEKEKFPTEFVWWYRCWLLLFLILDVYIVKNWVIRLSYVSLKKLTQSRSLPSSQVLSIKTLNLTLNNTSQGKKIFTFFLENLNLTKKSHNIISKTLFMPYPIPKSGKALQQTSFFLHFFKDVQSSKSCLIRFVEINFPKICFEKFIKFELFSQIYMKIKNLTIYSKINSFSLITYNQFK